MNDITFKYLNFGPIGGRGGVVRFFMLAHNLKYTEELIAPGADWTAAKAKIIETGENPAGTVPIVTVNGKTLTQHIAIVRELAKTTSYANDAIADQYQAFRDAWVSAAFMGGDKAKFQDHALAELNVFNALYRKYAEADTYIVGDTPLWGDSALFGLMRDLILTGFITEDDIPPRLKTMFLAYKAIPAVARWIAAKEAS